MEINPQTIYTYDQAKKLFGVGIHGLMKYIKAGTLVPSRVGHNYFFSGEELMRFIEKNKGFTPKHSLITTNDK